jgi:hypothetical protein
MDLLSVEILVLVMFALFLLSAISLAAVLYKWLLSEKGLPMSTRVAVTFVPLLIFFSFAHRAGNKKEVINRVLFSLSCLVGGLLLFTYLQWLKSYA